MNPRILCALSFKRAPLWYGKYRSWPFMFCHSASSTRTEHPGRQRADNSFSRMNGMFSMGFSVLYQMKLLLARASGEKMEKTDVHRSKLERFCQQHFFFAVSFVNGMFAMQIYLAADEKWIWRPVAFSLFHYYNESQAVPSNLESE